MSSNPEVLRLTAALSKYSVLFEQCGQCVRTFPNNSPQFYENAVKEWRNHPEFYMPPRNDDAARSRFFCAVDEDCKIEARTPEMYVLNPSLHWPRD